MSMYHIHICNKADLNKFYTTDYERRLTTVSHGLQYGGNWFCLPPCSMMREVKGDRLSLCIIARVQWYL